MKRHVESAGGVRRKVSVLGLVAKLKRIILTISGISHAPAARANGMYARTTHPILNPPSQRSLFSETLSLRGTPSDRPAQIFFIFPLPVPRRLEIGLDWFDPL